MSHKVQTPTKLFCKHCNVQLKEAARRPLCRGEPLLSKHLKKKNKKKHVAFVKSNMVAQPRPVCTCSCFQRGTSDSNWVMTDSYGPRDRTCRFGDQALRVGLNFNKKTNESAVQNEARANRCGSFRNLRSLCTRQSHLARLARLCISDPA